VNFSALAAIIARAENAARVEIARGRFDDPGPGYDRLVRFL